MKLVSGYRLRNLADEWIVIPSGKRVFDTRNVFTLNETSRFIWEKLECGIEMDDLVRAVMDEYAVDEAQVKEDLGELISILKQNNLLEM